MQPIDSERSIKVFISYAHTDQALHAKLVEHLIPLEYSKDITIWQDREIPLGEDWEKQINIHLNEAHLILFLVSASFLASKYCWNKEVQEALKRHKEGTVRVIPIILSPVLWKETPLGSLEALPTKAKPVTEWNNLDAAFEDVAHGIHKVVKELQTQQILPLNSPIPVPQIFTPTSHPIGNHIMIIVCVVILLFSILVGTRFIFLGKTTQQKTSVAIRATATSTPTSIVLSASSASIAYDFEGSGTGWDSDTQQYNAVLALTRDQAKTGHQSLKVTTQFIGNATSAYRQLPDQNAKNLYTQTNAKVYFTQEPPVGFSGNGPFNFNGKRISCEVFLPQWLLSGGEGKMQVQLFVKNRLGGGFEPNAYSRPLIITSSNIQKWVQLTFTVGNEPGGQVDQKFDPTQIQAVGVLLTVLDGSTINQKGSFYIDDCVL